LALRQTTVIKKHHKITGEKAFGGTILTPKSFKIIINGQRPITAILGNIGLVIQSIVR